MGECTIVLIDDDEDFRHALSQGLQLDGYTVESVASATEISPLISVDGCSVVVSDILMPDCDGFCVLEKIQKIDSTIPVILITGHGDIPLAVRAIKSGAYDFIQKPFNIQQIVAVISRAINNRKLILENRMLRARVHGESDMSKRLVGRTSEMERLRQQVCSLANADVDVLIHGETGSGKEVVARAIHDYGPRKLAPFMAINCAALPHELMESELFGHEKGAFTGANKKRIGKLEYANGGTVFLDEIESIPLAIQVKLLRAIGERYITTLGSNSVIKLDVRFIAATKEDLVKASSNGEFRQDLYYRLNVGEVTIPPLRERKKDIPLLFAHLSQMACEKYNRDLPDYSPSLERKLMMHDWPGNIRELKNIAERFVLRLWDSTTSDASDESDIQSGARPAKLLSEMVADFEKSVITTELQRNGGQMNKTYASLGLSRKGLYDKLKKYGVK